MRRFLYVRFLKLQSFFLAFVKDKRFEAVSLICIMVNMTFMMISDPNNSQSIINKTEFFFFWVFFSEMFFKMVGMGLFRPKVGFFRDSWNLLDFVIVIVTGIDILLTSVKINLSALRTLRVLRPLKTISSIKKLKTLIITIFGSLPFLFDIALLLLFIYIVYAIIGVHLYMGQYSFSCFSPELLTLLDPLSICFQDMDCQGNNLCISNYQNPFNQFSSFDSVLPALVLIHEIATANGFGIFSLLIQGSSQLTKILSIIYYISLIFLANFLTINLMLAVIVVKFTEANRSKPLQLQENIHEPNCQCSTGFNYLHMKECGYFLTMSHLKKNMLFKNYVIKYLFVPLQEIEKSSKKLFVNKEFAFLADSKKILTNPEFSKLKAIQYNLSNLLCGNPETVMGFKGKNKVHKNHIVKMKSESSNQLPTITIKLEKNESLIYENKSNSVENESERNLIRPEMVSNVFENNNLSPRVSSTLQKTEFIAPINFVSYDSRTNTLKINSELKSQNLLKTTSNLNMSFSQKSKLSKSKNSEFKITYDQDFAQKFEKQDNESYQLQDQFKKRQNFNMGSIFPMINKNGKKSFMARESKKQENADQNMNPVLIINEESNNDEKIIFIKDSNKSKKKKIEFGSLNDEDHPLIFKTDVNELKINVNFCDHLKFEKYHMVKNDIFPNKNQEKNEIELTHYNQSLIDKSARIVYLLENYQPNKIKKVKIETKHSSTSTYDKTTYDRKKQLFNSDQIVVSTGNRAVGCRENSTIRLFNDINRASKFYYYTYLKDIFGVLEDRISLRYEELNKICSPTIRKNKQINLKQKSKNYLSVKKFFSEDFFVPTINKLQEMIRNEFNNHIYLHIVKNDFSENQISTRNWSSQDVMLKSTQDRTEKIHQVFKKLNEEVEDMWLAGFYGNVRMMRCFARKFIFSPFVENVFLFFVFLNILILALDNLDLPHYDLVSNGFNFYFTTLFAIEVILKIFGLGVKTFSEKWLNILDFMIVVVSFVEIAISQSHSSSNEIRLVQVFRTIRVLRITKIFKSLKFMKIITEVISESLEHIFYIALLLLLFLVIFTLIGVQLFSGRFNFYQPGEIKRQNFDDFFNGFIAIFSVMTLQNWEDVIVPISRCNSNTIIGYVYIFAWMFIGNYILLNLFVAILLNGFSSHKSIVKKTINDDEEELVSELIRSQLKKEIKKSNIRLQNEQLITVGKNQTTLIKDFSEEKEEIKQLLHKKSNFLKENENQELDSIDLESKDKTHEDLPETLSDDELSVNYLTQKTTKRFESITGLKSFCEDSLFLFSQTNPIRVLSSKIVSNKYFEQFTFIMIILSSIKLIVDTYQDESWTGTTFLVFLNVLDYIFNGYFLLETTLKVITKGFIFPKNGYLREYWAIMDMSIVVSSTFEMILSNQTLGFLKTLRVLRTFRTLRFISHNKNLKMVVMSLLESIRGIVNVSAVILLFWIMYGILGVNLLSGKMNFCYFPDARNYYYINSTMCPDLGGIWKTEKYNFDNLFHAIVTLFGLSSMANWQDYMFAGMDANDASIGPIHYCNFWISIYYLIFYLMSGVFLSNLFIGIIFYEFANEQNKSKHTFFKEITEEQNRWLMMQKLIKQAEPNFYMVNLPTSKLKKKFFEFSHSNYFEIPVMFIIFLNTIDMAVSYNDMNPAYSNILDQIAQVFLFFFVGEAFFKILVQGPTYYFKIVWNRFDFALAILSIIDVALSYSVQIQFLGVYAQLARVLKLVRITRILKIIRSKKMETFNRIIQTLIFSFPAVLNIFALLILIYFFYAILGVFLFKDFDQKFSNFTVSFIFTFKMSLGESWFSEMFDDIEGSTISAYIFYLSYIFITLFITLRMFVFVIIQQFENFYLSSDNIIDSFDEISNEFRTVWVHFTADSFGSQIHKKDLYWFFIGLRSPLGFHLKPKNESPAVYEKEFSREYFQKTLTLKDDIVRQKITEMNLFHDANGFISFGQVLHSAMKNAFGVNCFLNTNSFIRKEIRKIEMKTVGKIFHNFVPKNSLPENFDDKLKEKKVFSVKRANPFNNLIFSQIIFKIWYRNSKRESKIDEGLSFDYNDIFDQNPGNYFQETILKDRVKRV